MGHKPMEYARQFLRSIRGIVPPVLVMYALAFGGNVSGLVYEETKLFSLVLLALIVPFSFRIVDRPPAVLPLTALVAVMCISMLISPSELGAWLVLLWAGVVIAFWASASVPIDQLERALMAVIMAMALIALYDVIEWWFRNGLSPASPIRPPSALWNPNIVAPVMMIGMALALYARRVTWLAVFLVVLVFSGSRGTFLGVAIGATILAVTRMPLPRLTPKRVIPGICFIAVLLLLFALQFRAPLSGLDKRVDLWRAAALAFQQHPLVGIGPERYRVAFTELTREQYTVDLTHAHNTYLHIAAEMGILGLLALGGIVVAAMRRIRQASRLGHRQEAAIAAALTAGLLANGIFDYPYWVLALVLMILWTGRVLLTPRPQTLTRALPGKTRWRLSITVGLAVLGYPVMLLAHQLDRQMGWMHQGITGAAFLLACALYATIPATLPTGNAENPELPGTM
ncbi:MAG: O-antigen ligase family protein [Anaerolineae bacterium]|nr:O-antigen ligase family protein [Anaerolineae bacterium]